uniref:Uncharacterized protein n=1 Tax=Haptolina brevifila TaxID=156173 RepID=A0A7S2G2I5_9EUKA|mmetsp:Transcript_26253/g.52647  ORF Transcript_26253/g.52647 Transcript_26253/m.52647 type:complete len:179 (+) Transcript_26253:85-621(+)
MANRWVAVLLVASAACAPIDSVHSLMEPAPPMPKKPWVRRPVIDGKPAARLAISPRNAMLLLPAAVGAMSVACPDLLTRLLVQLICFVGSLFEPFDTVLPQSGLLRTCITTVQQAKKAYNVKHGLVQIDEQQFFDEEDEEALAEDEEDRAPSDEGEVGEADAEEGDEQTEDGDESTDE